ncbi:MAG TPA: hypothetical protein VFN68_17530 [Acidimicrobiales bacterium]|nr:hypothetical protein [Acidimicrobiales bacterium]
MIAVEPELLAGTLARLLRSRGWQVQPCAAEPGHPVTADAAVLSDRLAGLARYIDAPVTIVLADGAVAAGRPGEPARGPGINRWEDLLDALGEAL